MSRARASAAAGSSNFAGAKNGGSLSNAAPGGSFIAWPHRGHRLANFRPASPAAIRRSPLGAFRKSSEGDPPRGKATWQAGRRDAHRASCESDRIGRRGIIRVVSEHLRGNPMPSPVPATRRGVLAGAVGIGLLVALPALARAPMRVEVWKSPTCGCCGDWIAHMREAGFEVQIHDTGNTAARARLGLPAKYGSCHTALVAGYGLEGHGP